MCIRRGAKERRESESLDLVIKFSDYVSVFVCAFGKVQLGSSMCSLWVAKFYTDGPFLEINKI